MKTSQLKRSEKKSEMLPNWQVGSPPPHADGRKTAKSDERGRSVSGGRKQLAKNEVHVASFPGAPQLKPHQDQSSLDKSKSREGNPSNSTRYVLSRQMKRDGTRGKMSQGPMITSEVSI